MKSIACLFAAERPKPEATAIACRVGAVGSIWSFAAAIWSRNPFRARDPPSRHHAITRRWNAATSSGDLIGRDSISSSSRASAAALGSVESIASRWLYTGEGFSPMGDGVQVFCVHGGQGLIFSVSAISAFSIGKN